MAKSAEVTAVKLRGPDMKLRERSRDPQETLLIIFGDTSILDDIRKHAGSLEKFRRRGGSILIASDRDDRGRLQELGLRITGGVVTQDLEQAYKGIPECPRITRPLVDFHSIFQGVTQGLATNRPSDVFQYRNSGFKLLASYSNGRRLDGNFGEDLAFLVGRDQVLVMASHTVFWNVLLAQPDNDNFVFAKNCVRWLAESNQGKRKYALFVEDGRIVTQFDVGLTVSALPFPTTQVLNRLLRGLEDENIFNRLLDRIPRERILRTLLILATLVLLLYGCKSILWARHRIETAVPLLTPLPSPFPTVQLTLPASRQQALLKTGNFFEPARDLARFFFEDLAQLPHGQPGNAPSFSVPGGWLERRRLNKQVHHLWQLAHGDPRRISKRQFRRLPAILDRLTLAVRTGRLKFE
jgi:hypothetical protein